MADKVGSSEGAMETVEGCDVGSSEQENVGCDVFFSFFIIMPIDLLIPFELLLDE